jgi:hypothetical protein
VQQQVLGPLFRHPWPVITPSKVDPTKPYERFNFLYSDSRKGEKALEHLLNLLEGDKTSIVINLGLSGAGKTYLLTQLALRRQRYVLFYDCGTNARVIGRIIDDYWESRSKPTDLWDYEVFSRYLKRMMSNFTLANAYALLRLIESDKIQPAQFLRYLENGGEGDVKKIFDVLREEVKTTERAIELKNVVVDEIGRLTGIPVVEAWDEAGLLTQWAASKIPFSNHHENPKTEFDPALHALKDAGSAFTVACRVARDSTNKTIFCGTALRLLNVEGDISKDLLKRVKKTTEGGSSRVLWPWDERDVIENIKEDLEVSRLKSDTLDTVGYALQGRPRLTTLFKNQLYHVTKANSAAASQDPDALFQR